MRDRLPPTRQNSLATHGRTIHATHGRTIHWVKSGGRSMFAIGPLMLDEQTSVSAAGMSVQCQMRTHAVQQTASYSITSSASANRVGGTSMPNALAPLRLMTSSNLVGCCTGKSAGLVPCRILST